MAKEENKIPQTPLSDVKKKLVGYLSALSVSICVVITVVAGQLLQDSIPPFQINFVRFILQIFVAAVGLTVTRTNPKLPLEWKPVLVMISSTVLNFAAGVLFIISSWYLPAALVHGFLETTLITLSGIFAIFRKKCTIDLRFAILFGCIGCLFMIQPFGMFNSDSTAMDEKDAVNYSSNFTCPVSNYSQGSCKSPISMDNLYGFFSAVCMGVCFWIHAQFNVEYLNQWISITSIWFWFGIGCAVLSVPVLGFLRQPILVPSPGQMGLELLFGIGTSGSSFFIMYAVTAIPLSHASVVLPSGLVFLYIFQKTLLKSIHPGPDNWIAILGLITILLGTLLSPTCVIIREKRKKNNKYIEKQESSPDQPSNANVLKLRNIATLILQSKDAVNSSKTKTNLKRVDD